MTEESEPLYRSHHFSTHLGDSLFGLENALIGADKQTLRFARLFAMTIQEPDEIWRADWDQVRFLARFEVDGEVVTCLVVFMRGDHHEWIGANAVVILNDGPVDHWRFEELVYRRSS